MNTDKWLKPKEVAEQLNISIYEVRTLIKTKILPSRLTPGGHHRVTQSNVTAYKNMMKEDQVNENHLKR